MEPHIIWDPDGDANGNVQHCLEHDVTVEEVEEVLLGGHGDEIESASSGRPMTFGYTSTGRYLAVV